MSWDYYNDLNFDIDYNLSEDKGFECGQFFEGLGYFTSNIGRKQYEEAQNDICQYRNYSVRNIYKKFMEVGGVINIGEPSPDICGNSLTLTQLGVYVSDFMQYQQISTQVSKKYVEHLDVKKMSELLELDNYDDPEI